MPYLRPKTPFVICGRWVELRRDIDYARMRGSKQMVRRMHNTAPLAT